MTPPPEVLAGAILAWSGGLVASAGAWAKGKARRLAHLPRVEPAALLAEGEVGGRDGPPPTARPPRLVVLTGVAAAPTPLACELDRAPSTATPPPAVVTTVREEALSLVHLPNGRWVRECHALRSASREAGGWGLAQSPPPGAGPAPPPTHGEGAIVPILAASTAAGGLPLSPVSDAFEPAASPPAGLSLLDSLLGRRPLGTRKVEASLPVGTPLTVVGEVVRVRLPSPPGNDADDGARRRAGESTSRLAVRPPPPGSGVPFLITSRPFDAVVADAANAASSALRVGVVAMVAGAGLALAGRLVRGLRARLAGRRAAAAARRLAAARAERAAARAACGGGGEGGSPPPPHPDDASSSCVVCLDAASEYVWVGCGHLAACESCAARTGPRCPVCRARGRALRVYRP